MTIKELREWAFKKDLDDRWWLNLDGVTEENPVSLNEVERYLNSDDFGEYKIMHVSKSDSPDPIWLDLTKSPKKSLPSRVAPIGVSQLSNRNSNRVSQAAIEQAKQNATSDKKIIVAVVLLALFGGLGLHALYVRQFGQAAIYWVLALAAATLHNINNDFWPLAVLLVAGFLIGDLIRLIMGKYVDGKGKKVSNWS